MPVPANAPLKVDRKTILGIIACALRGGAEAARWAHNPKVEGSNPSPATWQQVADGVMRCLPLPIGEVAQWQSRGLISPWLAVQIRPSPSEDGGRSNKAVRLPQPWEPVLHNHDPVHQGCNVLST